MRFSYRIRVFSAVCLLFDVSAKARFVGVSRDAEKAARPYAIAVSGGGIPVLIDTRCRKDRREGGLFLFVGKEIQKGVPQS